jgi:hypothetical protein
MQFRFVESQYNELQFPPAPDEWEDPDYFNSLRQYNNTNPLARHTPLEYLPDPGDEYIKEVEAIAMDIEGNKDLAKEAIKLLDQGQWHTVSLQGKEKRPGGLLDRARHFVVDPVVEAQVRAILAKSNEEDTMEL